MYARSDLMEAARLGPRSVGATLSTMALALAVSVGSAGCLEREGMDAANPQRGPGELVGNGDPITDGNFPGGFDATPAPREGATPPTGGAIECDVLCQEYCEDLGLTNPVNIGVCPSLWGAGLASEPVDRRQACRKLYADMIGRFPTPAEVNEVCNEEDWSEVVKALMATDEFVLVQQRRWADLMLYNNRIVNVERVFDMDDLVRKAYQGYVPWDLFASVSASHPVLTRRYDTAGDRAEAAFRLFLHRPPYESERSDMGRLYSVWSNGYREHAHLGTVPDAYLNYRCTPGADGGDAESCTSVLWGYNQIELTQDERAEQLGEQEGLMWSGYMSADEWETVQLPGRIMAEQTIFWEAAVDDVLMQYLGYDLGTEVQAVRHELVKYLLENAADIRSVHYAVATSLPYLQSAQEVEDSEYRWTYGPLKQINPEGWLDSLKRTTGVELGTCDHRIPHPEDLLMEENGANGWTFALVNNSRWVINEERELVTDYRAIAQTLGGCPTNEIDGRFTSVSILNTAVQEAYVAQICDPALQGGGIGVSVMLPEGMDPATALSTQTAQDIIARETRLFFGREPTQWELDQVEGYADACTPKPCTAESFARPACFALLSSAEMLFY